MNEENFRQVAIKFPGEKYLKWTENIVERSGMLLDLMNSVLEMNSEEICMFDTTTLNKKHTLYPGRIPIEIWKAIEEWCIMSNNDGKIFISIDETIMVLKFCGKKYGQKFTDMEWYFRIFELADYLDIPLLCEHLLKEIVHKTHNLPDLEFKSIFQKEAVQIEI